MVNLQLDETLYSFHSVPLPPPPPPREISSSLDANLDEDSSRATVT